MNTEPSTILVAVEDPETRDYLVNGIACPDRRVIHCDSHGQSLTYVNDATPDVVIVDSRLPDFSCVELLAILKESKPQAALITIVPADEFGTGVRTLAEGAFAYVNIPFSIDEVNHLIDHSIWQQRLMLDNQRLIERLQRSNADLRREMAERREMEEMLTERTAALATVAELATGVAHEINNPLSAVMTFSHLLMMQDLPESIAEDVKKIYSESQRAAQVVKNLLSFARDRQLETQYFDVTERLEETLALKAHQLRMNNVQVRTEFAKDLPKTMGDPHQFTQVFINLITNAEQAMAASNGEGILDISALKMKNSIRLSFADNGPGIPAEHLSKIFAPFFTTKEEGKGTGLGLSMCYNIVQTHGGRIWARSIVGKGSTFYLDIPILGPEKELEPPPALANSRIVGKSVLLVDDETLFVQPLARYLSARGHIVETAQNGDEAWQAIQQNLYHCIVLDMRMPGSDGKLVFSWLQEWDQTVAERVIFITGDQLNAETREFIKSTGNTHLEKPFPPEALEQQIQDCLSQEMKHVER